MPLHMTQPQKKYKKWPGGRELFTDELSDTGLYIPQRPKQVNLSTEVVKGGTQVGIEVVHGTRGTKGSTEMWYRNTHTHYYSYITTYLFIFFILIFFV